MLVYVQISGERTGPFTLEQLFEWVRSGKLRQGDYLLADDRSLLLNAVHIPELLALLDVEEAEKRRDSFKRWLNKTLALNTIPPKSDIDEAKGLKEENRSLLARLTELEAEIAAVERTDDAWEEELRRILEKKTFVDRERRKIETARELLERAERTSANRARFPLYSATVSVLIVIALAIPAWYVGVYRPSKEANENAARAAEKYDRANERLTEILYLYDEVQVLYEKLNRLNNRLIGNGTKGDESVHAGPDAELEAAEGEIERLSARIDEVVPGTVRLDVLVLPGWPAGDDPTRTDEALEVKLRPRRNLVLTAYGAALAEDPEIRGYVLVTAEIGRDGSVDGVNIKKTTIDAPIINEACKKTFEYTNFGKAESDTTCLFKFAFEPEG